MDDEKLYPLPVGTRVLIAFIYMLNITLAYVLMLAVMSFNAGVFIAAVGGVTIGYWIFGYLKKKWYNEKTYEKIGEIYNPEGDKCCTHVTAD